MLAPFEGVALAGALVEEDEGDGEDEAGEEEADEEDWLPVAGPVKPPCPVEDAPLEELGPDETLGTEVCGEVTFWTGREGTVTVLVGSDGSFGAGIGTVTGPDVSELVGPEPALAALTSGPTATGMARASASETTSTTRRRRDELGRTLRTPDPSRFLGLDLPVISPIMARRQLKREAPTYAADPKAD